MLIAKCQILFTVITFSQAAPTISTAKFNHLQKNKLLKYLQEILALERDTVSTKVY